MSERIIISKYGYGKTAKFYEDLIKETIEEKDKEIERLNNIIKEAREYIQNCGCDDKAIDYIEEILDKVGSVKE